MVFTAGQRSIMAEIISYYGHESQKMMLLEEMSELQKEICKDMRYDPDLEAITEEVADVLIMLEQIQMMYHISETKLHKITNEKLHRQLRRIEDEKSEQLQVPFVLIPKNSNGREIRYIADFVYTQDGQQVVEDVKGFKTALVCNHCGNDKEFYTRERYSGTCNVFFRTDDEEPDNTCMYDGARHKLLSKYIYCEECGRKVCSVADLKELDWK